MHRRAGFECNKIKRGGRRGWERHGMVVMMMTPLEQMCESCNDELLH